MLFVRYPRRTAVALTLMASQAFFYNAIFFTYTLVLVKFYGVSATMAPASIAKKFWRRRRKSRRADMPSGWSEYEKHTQLHIGGSSREVNQSNRDCHRRVRRVRREQDLRAGPMHAVCCNRFWAKLLILGAALPCIGSWRRTVLHFPQRPGRCPTPT